MVGLSEEDMSQLTQILQQFPEHEREGKKQEILNNLEQQQSQPPQCPFCMMVEGKIKTTNVYEDDFFLAVLEINPANPGHTLLFPKKHIQSLKELTGEEQERFFEIARKLNISILNFSEGSSAVLSSGKVTGVKYPHLIFNIMPRVSADEVFLTWKPKKVSPEELESFKKQILENLPIKKEFVKPAEPVNPTTLKAAFERMARRMP